MQWRPDDADRLAALLDGRLAPADRDAVLADLARDDELRAVLADAAAVLMELEAGDPAGDAAPPASVAADADAATAPVPLHRARRPLAPRRWLALAATVAAVALVPLVWLRSGGPDPAPAALAASLADARAGFPPGLIATPWPATRGPADPVSSDARAVRVGARLVELEVALRAGDPAAAAVAADVAVLLRGLPGAGPAVGAFEAAAADPVAGRAAAGRAAESALSLVPREAAGAGAWLQAARIAAARRDAEFFARQRRTTAAAWLAAREPAAWDRIAAAMASGPSDWAALGAELDRLLEAVAT